MDDRGGVNNASAALLKADSAQQQVIASVVNSPGVILIRGVASREDKVAENE